MPTINTVIPWFFKLFQELNSLGTYELVRLYYGDETNPRQLIKRKDVPSNSTDSSLYYSHNVDIARLNLESTEFWLRRSWKVKNPDPQPTGFLGLIAGFLGTYQAEWEESEILANIKVKENTLEVWVYGEKFVKPLQEYFAQLTSLEEDKKVSIELRQVSPLGF